MFRQRFGSGKSTNPDGRKEGRKEGKKEGGYEVGICYFIKSLIFNII